MLVSELITKSRGMLQDADGDYWTDAELLDYYNNGLRSIAAERKEKPTTTDVALTTGTDEYSVSGVLRYISIKDSDGKDRDIYPDDGTDNDESSAVIILDYNRIYVNNPLTGITLSIKHIAFPDPHIATDTVRSGDENALKYYILSDAYKKESDMENFQKAEYFNDKYEGSLSVVLKNSKLNYIDKVETTDGYYY